MSRNFKIIAVVGALALFVLIFFSFFNNQKDNVLRLGEGEFGVEVADTDFGRRRGLSGREGLEEGRGMWFDFGYSGYHGIWMKDMRFALDILWLDDEYRVVHIEENVLPETYPQDFVSKSSARYVLEVGAGAVKEYEIGVGMRAELF